MCFQNYTSGRVTEIEVFTSIRVSEVCFLAFIGRTVNLFHKDD